MRPARSVSFLRFLKREMDFKKSHTWPQTWNRVKQKIYKFDNSYMKWGPLRLSLFVTSRCNLQCSFCGWSRPQNQLGFNDMSFENFVRIMDRFRHAVRLELTGGEPFLNKEIFDMIEYAHKQKIGVEMSTNGTIIHNLLCRIISAPLSFLNISLDAYDSDEYRRMRGGSKRLFNTVVGNIRNLVEKRNKLNSVLRLAVSFVCTKANYRRIPNKVQLAEDLGVDIVNFQNLFPLEISPFLEDQCLYDDDSDVWEVIESVENTDSRLTIVMPALYKRNIVERNCKDPFQYLSVDADGNIATCCTIAPHRKYGNVFYDKDVWNNLAFQRMRRILMDRSLPLPNFCKTCQRLYHRKILRSSSGLATNNKKG